jgi:hypothetical protein
LSYCADILPPLLLSLFLHQIYREGLQAMLEPPGSYLAYACMYITCCLIKLFTLATNTYEEQHRHIAGTRLLTYPCTCPAAVDAAVLCCYGVMTRSN